MTSTELKHQAHIANRQNASKNTAAAAFSGRYADIPAVRRENSRNRSAYTKADTVSIPVIAARFFCET